MRIHGIAAVVLTLAGVTAAAACNDDNSLDLGSGANGGTTTPGNGSGTGNGSGSGTGSGSGVGVATSEQAAVFVPSEVASVAFVVNEGEVEQAQLAIQKAVNPDVKAFAQRMFDEHTQAVARLTPIVQNAGVVPTNDPTSAVLARQDRLVGQDLASLPAEQFDFAYMTAQVAAHSKAVAMVERSLLPSIVAAGNNANGTAGTGSGSVPALGGPDAQLVVPLQTELTSMRGTIARHLVDALRLQQSLRATTSSGGGTGDGGTNGGGTGDGGAAGDASTTTDAGDTGDTGAGEETLP